MGASSQKTIALDALRDRFLENAMLADERALSPSPLRGGVRGGGGSEQGVEGEAALCLTAEIHSEPPPPLPSPQGGGGGDVAIMAES